MHLSFRLLWVGYLLLNVDILLAQSYNRPVPTGVSPYTFIQVDSSIKGYYLAAPFKIGAPNLNPPPMAMMLDSAGFLCWYMPSKVRNLIDFKYQEAAGRYTYIQSDGPQNAQYMVMDQSLTIVDSFSTTNGVLPDVHDFQISSTHTFLLAGAKDSIMDLSAYFFNGVQGSPNTRVIGFVIQEFDEDHNLLFEWNSNDHIHPTASYGIYGYNASNFDYCHGNTIAEDTDGNLLVSFRHLNAVYKIDRITGAVIWKLGGKNSSFVITNDNGFSGQHDVRRLPNGNIALFDNANLSPPPRASRSVEYSLDTNSWTATKVWEYNPDPKIFSVAMGGHQTLPDRSHLVSYGLLYRPDPSFELIDDQGNVLSTAFFQDSVMSYRASFHNLPLLQLERPNIQCNKVGDKIFLSAPTGYAGYAWSTGENTLSIEASTTGIYQFWVNSGAGMLGSAPFVIEDLNAGCSTSGTETPQLDENQTVVNYYDLLGRPIQVSNLEKYAGRIYVVKYADGRVKLKFN